MTDKEQLVSEGEARVVVKAADMAEDMQQEAINVAIEALAQHAVERDVARSVKTAFDAAYGPAWHCVVGRDYGSYVTHEVGAFVYFFVGGWSVLLFRAGWVGSEGGGAEGGGDEGGSSAR